MIFERSSKLPKSKTFPPFSAFVPLKYKALLPFFALAKATLLGDPLAGGGRLYAKISPFSHTYLVCAGLPPSPLLLCRPFFLCRIVRVHKSETSSVGCCCKVHLSRRHCIVIVKCAEVVKIVCALKPRAPQIRSTQVKPQ